MALKQNKDAEHNEVDFQDSVKVRTTGKVAGILLDSSNSDGTSQPMTMSKMARMLNTTPYSVNESLLSLRDMGIIDLERGRIVINDKNRMHELTLSPCTV